MYGKPVPRRRGFLFWSLAPFLVLFLLAMPLLVELPTRAAVIGIVSVEIWAGLLLLVLFDPIRFWWAGRGVGATLFLGYVAYFLTMLLMEDANAASRFGLSIVNGIPGLVVFGLPGLCYALFGRFSFYEPEDVPSDDTEFSDENDDVDLDN